MSRNRRNEVESMAQYIMAEQNLREIPVTDKIFGISKLAKDRISEIGKDKVVDATIGSLLEDDGRLAVFSSIVEVLRNLTPEEYADYAPIAGVPAYLDCVKKATFGDHVPAGYIEAVATPGGTGAIRNTIQNYSKRGDVVLTSDWYWSPYKTISEEIERKLETFELFNADNQFNLPSFTAKVEELLTRQNGLVILFNAPAHNPTGYSPSHEEWDQILAFLKEAVQDSTKKITFFLDSAYLEFCGDTEKFRTVFPKFSNLPENLLVVVGFSMSKGYTLYGMRAGAMICITPNKAIADEFKLVAAFSSRGTWSNSTRPAMMALIKVFADPVLYQRLNDERASYQKLLVRRGNAFLQAAQEIGLETCPFSGGYFVTVPCKDADRVAEIMREQDDIFVIPIGKGVRVAISAISEEHCKRIPAAIKKAMSQL